MLKEALEGVRIERGENIAQMIMRARAFAIGAEPAQDAEFLFAKAGR